MRSVRGPRATSILVLTAALGCGSATLHGGADGSAGAGGAGHDGAAGSSAGGDKDGGNGGVGGGSAGAGGGNTDADATDASGGAGDAGCGDTTMDAHNCGACGHDCLGGACVTGVCQPFTLGTSPNDYVRDTIVSNGQVYVFAETVSLNSSVWQLDATTPSTPALVAGAPTPAGSNLFNACVMNGTLFWLPSGATPESIDSCSLASCAATMQPIVPNITDFVVAGPTCDTTTGEIVWVTEPSSGGGNTVFRASATGANARAITSFTFPSDGTDWRIANSIGLFSNGRSDRVYYIDNISATGKATLYYISTTTPDGTGVPVGTVTGAFLDGTNLYVIANDTVVLADITPNTSGSTEETVSAPLPNGILSGSPPMFADGAVNGVIDASSFYGVVSLSPTIPTDALIRCPLSAPCTSPTVIARGQGAANYFAEDTTAVYWTTGNTTGISGGFTVWKLAK